MDCLLIFDHLNDIVFTKFNRKFVDKMKCFAKAQGLLGEFPNEGDLTNDIFVQIFTPIVTSHRIMNCQFGNSYDSIKCEENLTMYFQEYMGYLFIVIGEDNDDFLRKAISVAVVIVRYLCGPDVYQMRLHSKKSKLANQLIDSWIYMQDNDFTTLVEAVEQLVVNSDLSGTAIKILRESVDKLTSLTDSNKIHALILVENKLLCLYSSQTAKELSSTDILFITILCHDHHQEEKDVDGGISSYQILLSGPEKQPKCLPHVVHRITLFKNVNLIYLVEIGNPAVAASIYETFCHLHTMQQVQIQRDRETLQMAFENLDIAIRRLNESLKKSKNTPIESCHKQLVKKWDVIKKKYQEYLKNASDESLLRAEALSLGFLENLKELLSLTSIDEAILKTSENYVKDVSIVVKKKLESFEDFIRTKSIRNFSLGSRDSLTINKYLEEFPGLVHFLYVDRTTHRVTTPTIDLHSEDGLFTKKKIWFMINFSRKNLQAGVMSLIWKDSTFNYAYFLWFEDVSGAPLKPAAFPHNKLPLPGILCEDFYEKIKEICFPKMPPNKIKCYELFCIHLGLVTASCVLEQTRRLSATVWELKGLLTHAIDFL